MSSDALSTPTDGRLYLPSEVSGTVDAAESAIVYGTSDRMVSPLKDIHARLAVEHIRRKINNLMINSTYGFINTTDYPNRYTTRSNDHCYEYLMQVYKRKAAHYQKIAANMRKVFDNAINEAGELL